MQRLPGLALYASVVCALAAVAAVVSFVHGNLLGIVWVLLVGLSSNLAWYYARRARGPKAVGPAPAAEGCASAGAGCGVCVKGC